MKTVGILGGGQLGTMLGTAVADMGARVAFYDPDPEAPACHRFADVTVAAWDDVEAMDRFAARCDVVTYEMEHLAIGEPLRALARKTSLRPSLHVLEITQDRRREKEHLAAHGLPHARFEIAQSADAAQTIAARFPRPFIVKTTRGGYDGKGQILVRTEADLPLLARLSENGNEAATFVFEEALDLVMEASCIVGRSPRGEVCFPVFENAHAAHILDVTLLPARLPREVTSQLEALARATARSLDVFGLLTVEFFLVRAGSTSSALRCGDLGIVVNELAPRPHNSGHVTRKACTASQFDLLARILLDVPLSVPKLVSDHAFCMGNLLGDVWLDQHRATEPGAYDLALDVLAEFPDVLEVVLYGKAEARQRRKMGHYVCCASAPDDALALAGRFRDALRKPILRG